VDDLKWSKSKIAYMPAKRRYCKEYTFMCILLAVSSSTSVYKYRDYFSTPILSCCLCSWTHASTNMNKLCCRHQVGIHHVPAFHVNLVQIFIHLTHFCLCDQTVYFKLFIYISFVARVFPFIVCGIDASCVKPLCIYFGKE